MENFSKTSDLHAWDTERNYAAKSEVKKYEKTNNKRVYLFKSSGEKGNEWYKAADNSALFYKYLIANRLHREAHIIADAEPTCKFKYIVSVKNLIKLNNQLKSLGYAPYEIINQDLGIVAFTLKKVQTKQEIAEFKKQEQQVLENVRLVAIPKNLSPELYNEILQLCRQLPAKIRHMEPVYRSALGMELLEQAKKALQIYSQFAKGLIKGQTAKRELRLATSTMASNLIIIAENGYWNDAAASRIGDLIASIELAGSTAFTLKSKNTKIATAKPAQTSLPLNFKKGEN